MDKEIAVSSPSATTRDDQWSPADQSPGGNFSGHDIAVNVRMVPSFMGNSGQGANQSTFRPKGSI